MAEQKLSDLLAAAAKQAAEMEQNPLISVVPVPPREYDEAVLALWEELDPDVQDQVRPGEDNVRVIEQGADLIQALRVTLTAAEKSHSQLVERMRQNDAEAAASAVRRRDSYDQRIGFMECERDQARAAVKKLEKDLEEARKDRAKSSGDVLRVERERDRARQDSQDRAEELIEVRLELQELRKEHHGLAVQLQDVRSRLRDAEALKVSLRKLLDEEQVRSADLAREVRELHDKAKADPSATPGKGWETGAEQVVSVLGGLFDKLMDDGRKR